jgi:hypothetical protein
MSFVCRGRGLAVRTGPTETLGRSLLGRSGSVEGPTTGADFDVRRKPAPFGAVVAEETACNARPCIPNPANLYLLSGLPSGSSSRWLVGLVAGCRRPKMRRAPLPTKLSADSRCVLNCRDRMGGSRCHAGHLVCSVGVIVDTDLAARWRNVTYTTAKFAARAWRCRRTRIPS